MENGMAVAKWLEADSRVEKASPLISLYNRISAEFFVFFFAGSLSRIGVPSHWASIVVDAIRISVSVNESFFPITLLAIISFHPHIKWKNKIGS
jgi:hypothetical protein